MPTWTLGTLMSRATLMAGRRDDISQSDASFYVNQAQTDFVRDFKEFLSEKTNVFSVNSGTSLLSLPADFGEPISLSHISTAKSANYAIPQISAEYADSLGYYPVGEPRGYFIDSNRIQLFPSASSSANSTVASGRSLMFRYRAIAADMTSTSSVPSVSTEHRIALLWKTVEYIHMHVGNFEEAVVAEARYTQHLQAFKDAAAKRQSERGGFSIRMTDRANRRLDGRLEDQTDEWLRR